MPRQRLKSENAPASSKVRPIVIVGAGNMGGALARGLIAKGLGRELIVVDPALNPRDVRRYRAAGATAVRTAADLATSKPRAIIFAVKPQLMQTVVPDYASVARSAVVVSIAAGTTSAKITEWLGGDTAIVRAMPNMPAAIGNGSSGAIATPQVQRTHSAL